MIRQLLSLGLLIVLIKRSSTSADNVTLEEGQRFYNLFSSITPYDVIKGRIEDMQECEPKAIWAFIRHGTRYPPKRGIQGFGAMTSLRDSIVSNHQESRGKLTEDELDRLRSWKPRTTYENEMLLTDSGVQELKDMGKRLKNYFPGLLENYKTQDIEIRTSSKTRTQQSAKAVFEGIFEKTLEITNNTIYDELIKNEDNCYSWKKSTNSKKLNHIMKEFQNTELVRNLQKTVSERLGFTTTMNFKVLKGIYEACRYEYAWYHNHKMAPWCAAFSTEDLKIMEYHQDLNYYYKSAFGNKYTPKLGCQFIRDIINKLSDEERKVTMYFGHSITNRKLLVTMGIGKGSHPLTADGYHKSHDRKWRSSKLTPFAANVFVVKYKCNSESDEPKLAIFVNEHLTPLPGHGDKMMYSMEEFKTAFSSITDSKYCNRIFCHDLS